ILSDATHEGWHEVTIHLDAPLLGASSSPPVLHRASSPQTTPHAPPCDGRGRAAPRPCSQWGLPSRDSRLPRWCALTAPFHPHPPYTAKTVGGRSTFCCTCPQVTLGCR